MEDFNFWLKTGEFIEIPDERYLIFPYIMIFLIVGFNLLLVYKSNNNNDRAKKT